MRTGTSRSGNTAMSTPPDLLGTPDESDMYGALQVKSGRLLSHTGGRMRKILLTIAMLVFFVTFASAQEVVIEPGDSLLIISPPAAPPETTFVEVPVPGPPTFECPVGWTCTEDPVAPDPDMNPPLAVSGVTVTITGGVALVAWNNRPSPDRGGAVTDGYYVASGNDDTGEANPTADVASSPHSIVLKAAGKHYFCVTPHNVAGTPEGACVPGVYELPPEPTSLYLLSVAPQPYSMSGVLDVVEGSYSVHLDRVDGAWMGIGDVVVPGVDSVVMCSGGACNRERRLPYELGGGNIDLTIGVYEISWEVFGDDPDSGSGTLTVTGEVGGVPDQPLSCDGDPFTDSPFKIIGPIAHGDSTVSVQLQAVPVPSQGCDGFAGITRALRDYAAELDGVAGEAFSGDTGWWWEDVPRDGTIVVRAAVEPIDEFIPWSVTYIEIPVGQ